MVVTHIDTSKIPKTTKDVIALGKKNAAGVGKAGHTPGTVVVHIKDTEKDDISATDVYIGVVQDENHVLHIVESVVNSYSANLETMRVLHSMNTKKDGTAALNAPLLSGADYRTTISVMDVLDIVNRYFSDILPEDMLKYYGYDSRPEGALGKSALYQARPAEGVSNRELLANVFDGLARTEAEREKLAQDLERLVNACKGAKPDSAGGRMIRQMEDRYVVFQSLYTDALNEAGNNFQAAKGNKNTAREGVFR